MKCLIYWIKFSNFLINTLLLLVITFDPPINAIPTDNFLFIPPESFADATFLLSSRRRICIIFSTSEAASEEGHPFN
jgi:hypothetical protein